jgi:hypothetical protein
LEDRKNTTNAVAMPPRSAPEQQHHDEGARVRAGLESDHVRGSERVPRQVLEDRTADRERGAQEHCEEHTRRTPFENHHRGVGITAADQRLERLTGSDLGRAREHPVDGKRDDGDPQGTADHRRPHVGDEEGPLAPPDAEDLPTEVETRHGDHISATRKRRTI